MEKSKKLKKSKMPNDQLRIEREKRGWSQSRLAQLINADPSMISRWETGERKPDYTYQEKLCEIFKKDAVELGFIDSSPLRPVQESSSLSNPPSASINTSVSLDNGNQSVLLTVDNLDESRNTSFLQSAAQQTLAMDSIYGVDNSMNRRDFLLTAGATVLTSASILSDEEPLNRFIRALKQPAVDLSILSYLENRTANYWRDRNSVALASGELMRFVQEDFKRVTFLLEGSLQPTIRARLCSTASEIAQLIGHLLLDIGDYAHARNYHRAAIIAAQEAHSFALQATALGRMALTWIYNKNPQKALSCIQEARHLAKGLNPRLQAYLAAIEAEVQGMLSERNACFIALANAEKFEEHLHADTESSWLRFDYTQLAGYKGACYLHLYRADKQDASLMTEAQETLKDALRHLPATRQQRRPILLLDLARTYAKQGTVEEAYNCAHQAMLVISQTKSRTALQRLLLLQNDLSIWEDTQYVKNLNEEIFALFNIARQ